MEPSRKEAFKKLLETEHDWPGPYHFRFIVPSDQIEQVSRLLPEIDMETRFSGQGRFISLNFDLHCENADIVLEIYMKVQSIPGIVSL